MERQIICVLCGQMNPDSVDDDDTTPFEWQATSTSEDVGICFDCGGTLAVYCLINRHEDPTRTLLQSVEQVIIMNAGSTDNTLEI